MQDFSNRISKLLNSNDIISFQSASFRHYDLISAENWFGTPSLLQSSIGKNREKYQISPIEIRKYLNDININLMFVHCLIVFIFNEQLSKSEQNYFLSASLYKSNQKAIIYGTHQQWIAPYSIFLHKIPS